MKTRSAVPVTVLLLLAGLAASHQSAAKPPLRVAMASQESAATLVKLARGAWELDQLMNQARDAGDERRDAILRVLTEMRDAIRLPGEESASHPLVDVNLESFRRDIVRARENAASRPPNYFWTGSVSGACVYCHAGEL